MNLERSSVLSEGSSFLTVHDYDIADPFDIIKKQNESVKLKKDQILNDQSIFNYLMFWIFKILQLFYIGTQKEYSNQELVSTDFTY